jgi:hypothetical protein
VSKIRLRLTSKGWYWHWMSWLGENGRVCEVLVGPEFTAERAYRAALEDRGSKHRSKSLPNHVTIQR